MTFTHPSGSAVPEKAGGTSREDSVIILEGESNYAPWLHFLIGHLSPEYWRILLGVDDTAAQHNTATHTVKPAQAASNRERSSSHTLTPEPDAAKDPNGGADLDNEGEDKRSTALTRLRATLNQEAKNLIRGIDSPSEAFQKIRLFYGKPRHQTLALRWAKWASLRYVPGSSAAEFVGSFGEGVRDIEEIFGDTLNHRTIFAQFVQAISADGEYPSFLLELAPHLQDPHLMGSVCAAFIRHESLFPRATPSTPDSKPASRGYNMKQQGNGNGSCPHHGRPVKHTAAECRIVEKPKTHYGYGFKHGFGGYGQQRSNKKRRLDSCGSPMWWSPL